MPEAADAAGLPHGMAHGEDALGLRIGFQK
jgi:hypothetical protein